MTAPPSLPIPRWTRRATLGLGLALARPAAASLPGTAALLVPGPVDGAFDRIAARLCVLLARGTGTAVTLRPSLLGGADGVTAANRFQTDAAPDGRTLLLAAGAAVTARLAGDPRAHFDPRGWLPICALQAGAVLAIREPTGGAPLRLGLGGPDGLGAIALLLLDLMGVRATPVPIAAPLTGEAAMAGGLCDAAVLQGGELPARLAALGARPGISLDPQGQRDPLLPDASAALEAIPQAPMVLRQAAQAGMAAARLPATLVLPALTPAGLVAAWRAAAARWPEEEGRAGLPTGVRALSGAEVGPLLALLTPPTEAVAAYREWLVRRLG